MTNQAITIIDELVLQPAEVKVAMAALAAEREKSLTDRLIDETFHDSPEAASALKLLFTALSQFKGTKESISPKSDAVLHVVTPRGWEVVNAALSKGDIEIDGLPVPHGWGEVHGYNHENPSTLIDSLAAIDKHPTSYEDVLHRNIAFLTRKLELMKVIICNTETPYGKFLMSEQLDKCESISEMNDLILD